MPIELIPYIPTYITVHLGAPGAYAENITVPFADYIKNVACSEIFPTWPEECLRANIIAEISFALNRVYTEYYPSRGYDFNITASTSIDQKYIKDRTIFQNISELVDDIFTHYIRRIGYAEPLLAQFCNGTTTTCDGLSQWGSESLANQGYRYWDILQYYYGENIELITDAEIRDIQPSFPDPPLRLGSYGDQVHVLQVMLNRVSRAYPLIPSIYPETGIFEEDTEESVRVFQSVFNLAVDGVVGKATWYKLVSIYTGLMQLSELISEGQVYFNLRFADPRYITLGTEGDRVATLQYVLNILAEFDSSLPLITIDSVFGEETLQAVIAFQNENNLVPNGMVDSQTWDLMLDLYAGIRETVLNRAALYPVEELIEGALTADQVQNYYFSQNLQYPGTPLEYGSQDEEGGGA